MKSVLRCQNWPQSVGFSIIGLLIASKKSVAVCGPLKRPKQAFSSLSISQCFDSQSRKAADGGKRGDVIRWSVFDLPPRFALNSLFAFDFLFLRFLSQDRGYPDSYFNTFSGFLAFIKRRFQSQLPNDSFVNLIFKLSKDVIHRTVFDSNTGNPLYFVLRLSLGLFLLYVVYRVIKRAINRV